MTDVNVQVFVDLPDSEEFPGGYHDAINMSMEDYRRLSASQVEALKQERIDLIRQTRAEMKAAAEAQAEAGEQEVVGQPVTSVAQARQILNDALAQLDALPADPE